MPDSRPIVVTLVVDEVSQRTWNALRRRWFPPERLRVDAHLTLFHALPGDHAGTVVADVAAVGAATAPFPLRVGPPYSLGGGVAVRVAAAELAALHARLRRRWEHLLTRQDAQPFRPHVTVQNKVAPAAAARTLAELTAEPPEVSATATGIALWRYAGGPWEHLATTPFLDTPAQFRF